MNLSPISGRFSDHANAIRGLAALAVVAGHVRAVFLTEFRDLAQPPAIDKALYLISGLGHQAVMVFFVLSGFLVGGSALKAAWSWGDYLSRRLFRLYVVLIPALLLTWLTDHTALLMANGPACYLQPLPPFNEPPFAGRMSGLVLAGNIAFLQTIAVSVFGSDSPLWSLANEFWYYILFPLMVRCWRGAGAERAACAALFLVLAALLPLGLLAGGAIWLLGVAVRTAPLPAWPQRWVTVARWASGLLFLAVTLEMRRRRVPEAWSDFPIGVAFAFWLYWLYVKPSSAEAASAAWYRRGAALIAGCSYTIYATHYPLVVFTRVLVPPGVWAPQWWSYAAVVAIIVTVCFAGYLISLVTEARTDRAREFARGWWAARVQTQ